jgi:hypothetical protein
MEEMWAPFPSWMNPTMNGEKRLKEGLEKAFENHDNMKRTSFLEYFIGIGYSSLGANLSWRFH